MSARLVAWLDLAHMKYTKPALTVDEQVEVLRGKGMRFRDVGIARRFLSSNSYRRMRPYFAKFLAAPGDGERQRFQEGTWFEDVVEVYEFDHRLRLCVRGALDRIEVELRTQWVDHMSLAHGPHGYLDAGHYRDPENHKSDLGRLETQLANSWSSNYEEYRQKYSFPHLPPAWTAAEGMTFGLLSKFIGNLHLRQDRQAIADWFEVKEKVFCSFLVNATIVRNACAHHQHLWNKRLPFDFAGPTKHGRLRDAVEGAARNSLYFCLVMICHVLSAIDPDTDWRRELLSVVGSCPLVDPSEMGFPADWRKRGFWGLVPPGNYLHSTEGVRERRFEFFAPREVEVRSTVTLMECRELA